MQDPEMKDLLFTTIHISGPNHIDKVIRAPWFQNLPVLERQSFLRELFHGFPIL